MYWNSTNEDFNATSKLLGSELNFQLKLKKSCCVDYEYDQNIDDAVPLTFCIKNTFELQKDKRWIEIILDPDIIFHPSTDIDKLDKDKNPIFNYIYPLIKKMRLFKEGNICMPFHYCYYISRRDFPILNSGLEYGSFVVPELYTFTQSEITEFKDYLQTIQIPFSYKFLQFAFENFELSYEIQNKNLQFLTLMNGMEALFNTGGAEISYKLRRNVAVLLGEDEEDSKTIESNMKTLYGIRSNIVHNGHAKINEKELSNLREYLRQSIISCHKLNLDKDFIFDLLSRRGFGDSPIKNI